jgi:putative intracellular protease/amidase
LPNIAEAASSVAACDAGPLLRALTRAGSAHSAVVQPAPWRPYVASSVWRRARGTTPDPDPEDEGICNERLVGSHSGDVVADDGTTHHAEHGILTTASVLSDAIYLPGGEHATKRSAEADAVDFARDAYKHCEAVAATGTGIALLQTALVPTGHRATPSPVDDAAIVGPALTPAVLAASSGRCRGTGSGRRSRNSTSTSDSHVDSHGGTTPSHPVDVIDATRPPGVRETTPAHAVYAEHPDF